MDTGNNTTITTSSSLDFNPTTDTSPSDDARSADSGVVLRDTANQSDENDSMHTQPDLSKLFRLEHRSIVVTGGLGGLGIGLVRTLLQSGADVIVTDMASQPSKETWNGLFNLATSTGRVLEYISCDVTSPASVKATMEQAARASPHPIRGLVTCAGISGREHATSYSHDAFKRIFDVNVTGTFLCAQAIARIMHEQCTPGSIVLIGSMSGSVANKGVETVAYNSSKAAVLQMARNLAAEWGNDGTHPPIRVNTVSPGYIQTQMTMPTAESVPALKALWEGGNMLGRLSEVQEHLSGIIYLLADGSSYVTGADIRADGGHCAW